MLSEMAKNIRISPTLEISARAKQLKKEGKDIISLSAGEPDFDTPGFIKAGAEEALKKGFTKYTPAGGTPELIEAVRGKLRNENNLEYDSSQIMINCGAKHSLFNIILCSAGKGDEVIIPAPYWVSYPEMVRAAGAKPVIADCTKTGFKITPDILKPLINRNSKALILNSPSNPSGTVYSEKELEEISGMVLENDLLLISDEIYEYFVYEGGFISPASLSDEIKKNTVIVNGLSKSFSMTGWRIGYAAGNASLISACIRLQSHSTSNPTSFAQAGAVSALTSKDSQSAVRNMSAEFKKRRDYVYERLSGMPCIEVGKPEGAFYIFPSVKSCLNGRTSLEFTEELLSKKYLAVVPGEGFGTPGFIRISYAAGMEELKEAMDRLESFLINPGK